MNEIFQSLNSEQKQAVTHKNGPLLIVAGAGTGKTTVITQRIDYLIQEKKVRPDNILALTFTDKAAGEMAERVDQLLPYGYVDLWIYTFHAFTERILKDHGLEIGIPNDFKLLDQTKQWLLVRQNLDKFNLDYYKPLGNPTKFIHALIKLFSRAKDENITPEDYLKYAQDLKLNSDSREFAQTVVDEKTIAQLSKSELKEVLGQEIKKQQEIADAYHTYQQLLLDNNALDFGDLINYCLKLFKERKNILAQYRQQFKYILVDEFQDTNLAQYELVKLLAAPDNNITVVGDDDQAIYKFRGASIANILQFKEDYPDSKEIFLNTNYRSFQNILDLSYEFIQQNNPYRLEVKLGDGYKLNKKLQAKNKGQGQIEHLYGATLEDEVEMVVKKIINLYNNSLKPRWSDFAILIRANSAADNFIYALEKANLPYNFVANRGLYSKKVVLDILAYLKMLDNYHEASAMYRIISLPLWDFSAQDIINLNYWSKRKGWSLYEVMKKVNIFTNISTKAQKEVTKLLALIDRHSQLVREGKPTTEIIQAFFHDSSYLKKLTSEDSVKNSEQLEYLSQFYKKVQEFEKETYDKSVKNFLLLMALELDAGEEGSLSANIEEGPDTVKILTVHSAKGLEFKYVFVVNLVDQRFPTNRRSEAIAMPDKLVKEITPEGDVHLQEERRLFYVAMTRAKQGLYLTSGLDYGGARKKKPSRFLIELSDAGFKLAPSPIVQTKTTGLNQNIQIAQATRQKEPNSKLPKKFSFSQLKAFETCPYQYRFAYVLKVPTSGSQYFSFGKSMHATLEKFFRLINEKQNNNQSNLFGDKKESRQIGLDDLLKQYDDSFIDDWYLDQKTKEEYYKKGKNILKEFYNKHKDKWPQVEYLEFPFNLKLGEHTVYGKIDRIDNAGEAVKLVDYKTGHPKKKLTLEEKEQLLIYQMATGQVLKQKVDSLTFYYLDDNSEVIFLGQDNDLEKVQNKIIKTIDNIKKGDFPPTPGRVCGWCDFKHICEFKTKGI